VRYTTNAIESLNSVIRHAIKKRKVFPTDEAVKKVVWLAIQSASQKWTMPLKDWRMEMSRFIIKFSDRLDGHFWEKAFTQNPEQARSLRPDTVRHVTLPLFRQELQWQRMLPSVMAFCCYQN